MRRPRAAARLRDAWTTLRVRWISAAHDAHLSARKPSGAARLVYGSLDSSDACVTRLLDIAERDPRLRRAMSDLGLSRNDLAAIFTELVAAGAGVWVSRIYVPASVVTDATALRVYCGLSRGSWKEIEDAAQDIISLFRRRLAGNAKKAQRNPFWRRA